MSLLQQKQLQGLLNIFHAMPTRKGTNQKSAKKWFKHIQTPSLDLSGSVSSPYINHCKQLGGCPGSAPHGSIRHGHMFDLSYRCRFTSCYSPLSLSLSATYFIVNNMPSIYKTKRLVQHIPEALHQMHRNRDFCYSPKSLPGHHPQPLTGIVAFGHQAGVIVTTTCTPQMTISECILHAMATRKGNQKIGSKTNQVPSLDLSGSVSSLLNQSKQLGGCPGSPPMSPSVMGHMVPPPGFFLPNHSDPIGCRGGPREGHRQTLTR